MFSHWDSYCVSNYMMRVEGDGENSYSSEHSGVKQNLIQNIKLGFTLRRLLNPVTNYPMYALPVDTLGQLCLCIYMLLWEKNCPFVNKIGQMYPCVVD